MNVKFSLVGVLCIVFANVLVVGQAPTAQAIEEQAVVPTITIEKGAKGNIAILKEKFKDVDLKFTDVIASELRKSGYGVTFLNCDQLSEKTILSTENFFLLMLPYSKIFPASAQDSLVSFLKSGGDMLCFEGPPFESPAWKLTDKGTEKWMTKQELEEFLSRSPERNTLFDFESGTGNWSHISNGSQGIINNESPGAGRTDKCVRVDADNLQGWDLFIQSGMENSFPQGYTMTSFWAKGDEKTKQLLIQWTEEDQSRWNGVVQLETKWKFYILSLNDFKPSWDNASKGRGGPKDRLNPQKIAKFAFGVAFGETPEVGEGPHTYWIDEIGTIKTPSVKAEIDLDIELEAMAPLYKFYPVKDIATAIVEPEQTFIKPELKISAPAQSWSCVNRPRGVGYQPGEKTRWIPLIYAKDKSNEIRGTLAYLYLTHSGKYRGAVWGAFSIPKEEFLKNSALMSSFTGIVDCLKEGAYITKGGSREFSYFPDETSVKLGAEVANFSGEEKNLLVRILVCPQKSTSPVFKEEKSLKMPAGEKDVAEFTWEAGKFTSEIYNVRIELLKDGKLIDVISHELGILPWTEDSPKEFVTVRNGDFWLKGKKWYPFGLNYWPLYVSGIGKDEYGGHWLSPGFYDPGLVEPDLKQIKEWGMTALSILVGGKTNVRNSLDFMRRCRNYGFKINLFISFAHPLDFREKEVQSIIKTGRYALNDTLFAYDVAWEPRWGNYEGGYGNPKGRKGYEQEWKEWVIERYGSIENAEKDWGYSASKGSYLPAPSDKQLDNEGEWVKYNAAYYRFVDDFLCKKYGYATRKIKEVDPNHFVSFRMSTAGDVWQNASSFGYDFRGIAKAVDFLAPEGYGLNGDWEKVKGGLFTTTYARYADPAKPVIWVEYGMSVWKGSVFEYSPSVLEEKQATFWADIHRMIVESGANGGFGWWYPGGYRVDEKSDFGVAPPDRTLRPVAKSIIKYAPLITTPRQIPEPDKLFVIDRDAYCRGYKGVFEEIKNEYFETVRSGHIPGFKTKGTGTSSISTPLVAVGNAEYNGSNPPKYLNAVFNYVRIKCGGEWIEVENGKKYNVKPNEPVLAAASIGNNGEAAWICPANAKGAKGGVYLVSTKESQIEIQIEIKNDVPYLGDVIIPEFKLVGAGLPAQNPGSALQVGLEMSADNRCRFGEKLRFTLVPAE